jgi:hypothetical protein
MKEHFTIISRRKFLVKASLITIAGSLFGISTADASRTQFSLAEKKLWDEFSADEKDRILKSKMARIAMEIEGGSCAEKVLLTTIRYFKKPDRFVSFASSFGGGIRKGDLCGMLTGGFMSIGFASERLIKKDEEKRSLWVRTKTDEYWEWWLNKAPRHCNELRPCYANEDRSIYTANFNRMLQRVALKLEEMFEAQRDLM